MESLCHLKNTQKSRTQGSHESPRLLGIQGGKMISGKVLQHITDRNQQERAGLLKVSS